MKVALFWLLQAQFFYKELHRNAVEFAGISTIKSSKNWADIGCGVGLMSHIADERKYRVSSYDLDKNMISWAKFLNKKRPYLLFYQQDVMAIDKKYDVVSATSLLSVVSDTEAVLNKLRTLLRDKKSKLILIEPTKKMSLSNAWKMINDIKTFNHFKLLLVWAMAREGKAIDSEIFSNIKNISHCYFLNGMVRITVIGCEKINLF